MAIRHSQHLFRGMQRDLTVSKFNPEFYYDAQNIRITARENSTLLSVTNEKGNKQLEIIDEETYESVELEGVLLGSNVLNNNITLFLKNGTEDIIYHIHYITINNQDTLYGTLLFKGNLNFDTNYPIETLGVFENEDIQKVYWVDGRNQARVINIALRFYPAYKEWDNTSFDFVQTIELLESIKVERNDMANGIFSSGVIQYAFTYYNLYGQESNIFNVTPLQYISPSTRGASPEEKVSTSFELSILNPDPKFDYLRIYSIQRTSEDGTPTVLHLTDISVKGLKTNSTVTFVDNGTTGSLVDPDQFLYTGGEEVIFQTMAQKDNTLFLGNARLKRRTVSEAIRNEAKQQSVRFNKNTAMAPFQDLKGSYPYTNTLKLGDKVKTYKYLEWYRIGIQLQSANGKWSEPIFIKDVQNKIAPEYSFTLMTVNPIIDFTDYFLGIIKEAGYKRIRGLVVHPTLTDREVVAQGMLCPTVFNMSDRFSNSPFSQASWFSRPSLQFDINKNYTSWTASLGGEWDNLTNSKAGVVHNDNALVVGNPSGQDLVDIVNRGAWAEFRHGYPIPPNTKRNAEIQCLSGGPDNSRTKLNGSDLEQYVSDNSEFFFIDQSIITFHSPDIEFDEGVQNLDTDKLKLRIVGMIPITGTSTDIDIQTKTPQHKLDRRGFFTETVGTTNDSFHGLKSRLSGGYWLDGFFDSSRAEDYTAGFMVYPWHRNGSLNNQGTPQEGVARTAMLERKKMSNLKYSNYTHFLVEPWNCEVEGSTTHTGISGVQIFNSNEVSLVRIPAPKYSKLESLNYYGNIDKIITPSRPDKTYTVRVVKADTPAPNIWDISLNSKDGYPIVITDARNDNKIHELVTATPATITHYIDKGGKPNFTNTRFGTDPVRMKYKSTPHAVMALNYTTDGRMVVLPTVMERTHPSPSYPINPVQRERFSDTHYFWNTESRNSIGNKTIVDGDVYQDVIDNSLYHGFLFLGELYRDEVVNRFGGDTVEAMEQNIWLPASNPISLTILSHPINSNRITLSNGDTFLQRYDCLKTYPFTQEDTNSVVEIVSFMCETRVNLDGRYDKNVGQLSNLTTTPENFNKINKIYGQKDNFFNYRGLNPKRFNLDYFPNTVTWTKEKFAASIIDPWTNITMASTIDLDGDKGEVVSLNTFNNEIFCFQREGLSNILFNSRVQIPTSDNVPIEISNGMKVQGKRYVSNTIGCSNKWSIAESPLGLYFIDNVTNSIYLFNGTVNSLSDNLGLRQWVGEHNSSSKWNPVTYKNFRTFYDKNNNDVYFTNSEGSLCYSELLGQFTSFMSYGKVPAMFNVNSDFIAYKNNSLWEQFAGDYNSFFGESKPFSLTIVGNMEPTLDKVFNTVEFRADSWTPEELSKESPFTTLEVWNEYQRGITKLKNVFGKPSPLKKKFRIWRANIPRDNNGLNRIRNPWAFIKLSNDNPGTNKIELHDIKVSYTI